MKNYIPSKVLKELEEIEKKNGFSFATLNIVASYLWEKWIHELKKEGWNWQKFLKLLSCQRDGIVRYVRGEISWEELIRKTLELIEGPVGEMIKIS
ncbi:MAG: hypothetical protein ACP5IT_11305 [Thermoproteota archaeon]